jgi:hypothetical protein
MDNRSQNLLVILTVVLILVACPAVAQNAPAGTERPQGQAPPPLAPTAFPTGGDAWLAPPGTSVSINRTTGTASFALPTQPVDGSREQIARFDHWRKHFYPGTGLLGESQRHPVI